MDFLQRQGILVKIIPGTMDQRSFQNGFFFFASCIFLFTVQSFGDNLLYFFLFSWKTSCNGASESLIRIFNSFCGCLVLVSL